MWNYEDFVCDMVGNCLFFVLRGDLLRFIDEDVGIEWNVGFVEFFSVGEYEGEGGDCDDEGEDDEGEFDEFGDEKGDSGVDVGCEGEELRDVDECDDLDE